MTFFESLRTAVGRYSAGVHLLGAPADSATLDAAESRLGSPLPTGHREFLRSFNGAALFHESLLLFSAAEIERVRVGERPWHLKIGETPDGALYTPLGGDGRIYLVDEEAPDPLLTGTSTESWLDATLAREGLLFDREGEFRDVFVEDGLSLPVRRKRVQLGRRHDSNAALYILEQAELAHEEGDLAAAVAALRQAVACDPLAGPAWEMLATLCLDNGDAAEGAQAALRAAEAAWHPPLATARQQLATRLRTRDALRVL